MVRVSEPGTHRRCLLAAAATDEEAREIACGGAEAWTIGAYACQRRRGRHRRRRSGRWFGADVEISRRRLCR